MTHRESEPCPFKGDNHPIGMFGSCCSYRGNMVALYLIAMGLGGLALDLFSDKTPEGAIEFASKLRGAVVGLKKTMSQAAERANAPVEDLLNSGAIQVPDVGWSFSAGQAFGAIEAAARWFELIGQMDFGVHAWF